MGVVPNDIILGRSSGVAITSTPRGTPDPWTIWAISDKPESRGQLLWTKTYPAPPQNYSQMFLFQPIDTVNRVFTMSYFETGERLGYSLDTGEKLWGPVGTPYSQDRHSNTLAAELAKSPTATYMLQAMVEKSLRTA